VVEVRFVDTSVLCNLLAIPGKCQREEEVRAELDQLVSAGVQLILPIATIIETGNHIVQVGDGHARRRCAASFIELLRATAEGALPWVVHAVAWDERMILLLCEGSRNTGSFVEVAAAGVLGAGDVAILAERDMFARRTAALHVGVWTHDARLAAYAG